jgi:hypothetical protein
MDWAYEGEKKSYSYILEFSRESFSLAMNENKGKR